MKKMILTIALLAVVGVVSAQNSMAKEQREKVRAQRAAAYTTKMDAATIAQNITFTALYMQPEFTQQQQVGPLNNFLTIYPTYLDCALPYVSLYTGLPVPPALDFIAPQYTYKASLINSDNWKVEITVQNVTGPESPTQNPYSNYSMLLIFSHTSGNATLTITPEESSAVTYVGSVRPN